MNHYFCVWGDTPTKADDTVADRDGRFLWVGCGTERKTTVKFGDDFSMALAGHGPLELRTDDHDNRDRVVFELDQGDEVH
jgi:hypothetical protein